MSLAIKRYQEVLSQLERSIRAEQKIRAKLGGRALFVQFSDRDDRPATHSERTSQAVRRPSPSEIEILRSPRARLSERPS
jgi:hypothetical protein